MIVLRLRISEMQRKILPILFFINLADLAISWSELADVGNLAVLALLADLADWNAFFV